MRIAEGQLEEVQRAKEAMEFRLAEAEEQRENLGQLMRELEMAQQDSQHALKRSENDVRCFEKHL